MASCERRIIMLSSMRLRDKSRTFGRERITLKVSTISTDEHTNDERKTRRHCMV